MMFKVIFFSLHFHMIFDTNFLKFDINIFGCISNFWLAEWLKMYKTEIFFISWSCLTFCDVFFFFFLWNYIFPLKCCFCFLRCCFLYILLCIYIKYDCIIGVLLKSKKRTCTFIMAEVDLFSSANVTGSHHHFKNLMEINYVLDSTCC